MTPERFNRLRTVLDRRQPDLTVLLDNVHKPHNLSAILRTCDAVGIFEVHAVWPSPRLRPHRVSSSGTGKWVRVITHPTIEAAASTLAGRGVRIIAAHPESPSKGFREVDYTGPVAVLLGAELDGVSAAALARADERVSIPMHGLGASLNVSVAAALLLSEAERQRTAAGLYEQPRLDPDLYRRTLFEWAHPRVAAYCRERDRAYPALDEHGELVDTTSWR